jgi:hypothetical protein
MSGTGPTADEGLPGDKPQNSRDPLLVLVRFILIFLPGCTCPASAGLSFVAAERIPGPRVALRRRIFVTALDLSPMESFRVECLSSTPSPALQEAGLFLDDGA